MIKTKKKKEEWGELHQIDKEHLQKYPKDHVIFNVRDQKNFPLRSGRKQECSLLQFIFNIVWEVLPNTVRQEIIASYFMYVET